MRSCTPGFHNMAWSILTHCEFGIVYATLLRGPQRYLLLLTSDFGALPASELSFHCGGYLMAALRSFACTMGVACCANLRYSRNLRFTFHFHRWLMHDDFCLPCAPYCRHSRRRPHVFSSSKTYAFRFWRFTCFRIKLPLRWLLDGCTAFICLYNGCCVLC